MPPVPQRLMGLCPGCVAIGDYMPFLAARSLAWGFVSARTMLMGDGGSEPWVPGLVQSSLWGVGRDTFVSLR